VTKPYTRNGDGWQDVLVPSHESHTARYTLSGTRKDLFVGVDEPNPHIKFPPHLLEKAPLRSPCVTVEGRIMRTNSGQTSAGDNVLYILVEGADGTRFEVCACRSCESSFTLF
jgi:hypothetical protein